MNERVKFQNQLSINKKGRFVVYWVQTGLRIDYNYSLLYSINQANQLNLPLLVVFGLKDNFSWANLRQYTFLKQGIIEFKNKLDDLGINFIIKKINQINDLFDIFNEAAMVIADFGYLI